MLKALREKTIARLWLGQALSSIGDEIYRVGLTWMVVGIIGADTGYLNAGQAAALMILSFIGGRWADRWQPLAVMVHVDTIRAGVVLIPVVYSYFAPVPLAMLVVVALTLSALGAFFDPALQTSLPLFARDLGILRAATGLMQTTTRLARTLGPVTIGALAGVCAPIHFFTLDAVSFLISAISVRSLRGEKQMHKRAILGQKRPTLTEAVLGGFRLLREQPGMDYIIFAKAMTGGTWNLAYGLGFALLVKEIAGDNTRAFASVMASYGIGNLAGALLFGNMERRRPALMMFVGFIWLGAGFVVCALMPSIAWLMPAAAVTGFSGIMNEVTFADLVQAKFSIDDMPKIFRLRMACDTTATLFFMIASPLLLHWISVRQMMALMGVIWIAVGGAGFGTLRFPKTEPGTY